MATAEWNQLYDRYYRKSEIYDMVWDLDREEGRKGRRKGPPLDLDKYIIAGAPFGGPIAMIVDERKVPYSFSSTTAQSSMKIYTSAGKLISSFTWAYAGLVAIGWTERHDLVCVMDDGSIYIYSVHGERINTFDLGHACREYKVAECCFWSDGFVVRTGNT